MINMVIISCTSCRSPSHRLFKGFCSRAQPLCSDVTGSGRCKRLLQAVQQKANAPPADLRYLSQPHSRVCGETATGQVVAFLHSLYESTAETLPDVREAPDMVKKASSLVFYEEDNYAGSELVVGGKLSRKRTRKMSLNIDTARAQNFEERHLPPGCMKDHYETFRTLTGPNAASFKTFWKVWHEQFSFLKFRPTSSHAQCSACCRHKLLIRGLSNHLAARKFQIKLLGEHLLNQYRDRQIYWSLRGQARLKPSMSLVAIIDSMDQMKFQYPRTPLAYSKDLSTLIRPKLHLTACIAHGFSLMFFVAKHNHPKDSSLMAEIVCHMLTRYAEAGHRLDRTNLFIQCDNTTRELKNNTLLRLCAGLTESATLCNLRSGHSHEDVDQVFGSVGKYLIRHARHVETPSEFADTIRKFCAAAVRPFENDRVVIEVDQHRDWSLTCASKHVFVMYCAVNLVSTFYSWYHGSTDLSCGDSWNRRDLRRGFLAEAVPVALQGVGGPGAPHWFQFNRRESLSFVISLLALFLFSQWKLIEATSFPKVSTHLI